VHTGKKKGLAAWEKKKGHILVCAHWKEDSKGLAAWKKNKGHVLVRAHRKEEGDKIGTIQRRRE
jgi:predicted phosphatase